MNDNLLTQLREYGSHLEAQMSPLDVQDVATSVDRQRATPPRPVRPWTSALVASAAIAVVAMLILFNRSAESPVATTPAVPSNGWVAVAAPGVGDQDIFITREGEEFRRIVGSDGDGFDQVCPAFSPDGSKLAYDEANRAGIDPGLYGGPTDVVVVEFDGNADAAELFRATSTLRGCVTWSPDSTRVAYVVDDPAWSLGSWNQWQLHVATVDGEITSVFDNFGGNFGMAWSPDGSAIALRGQREDSFDGIWIVPVDGGAPQLLSQVSGGCDPPSLAWSPDGSRIASSGEDGFGSYIRILSTDGSSDYTIASGRASSCGAVAWSPDGARLAWGGENTVANRIVLLNPDGSALIYLAAVTLPGETETPDIDGGPIWAPDGTSLLVSARNRIVSMTDVFDVTIQGGKAAIVSVSIDPQGQPTTLQYWDEGIDYMGGLSWQPVFP